MGADGRRWQAAVREASRSLRQGST